MTIVEHIPNGFEITQFHATDADESLNAQFVYSLKDPSGSFNLDPKSGKLRMRNSDAFDREKFSNFELEVSAVEVKPSVITDPKILNSNKIKIKINVDDDNDNGPIFLPSKISVF